jgi:hypothetical protein
VRGRRGLLLVVLLWAAAGCGGSDGEVIRSGGVTVLVSERTDRGMLALLPGSVEVVDGCLGVGGHVVIWPHGTVLVEDDTPTVDVPGLGRLTEGDEVEIGGGFILEHTSQDHEGPFGTTSGVTVPAPCAENDVFLAGPGQG